MNSKNLKPFKKGQSGNPAGKPKGTRSHLSEAFIDDILKDWKAHGVAAIKQCREENAPIYLKVVASLVPKEIDIKHTLVAELEGLTDEQIQVRLENIRRANTAPAGVPADTRTH